MKTSALTVLLFMAGVLSAYAQGENNERAFVAYTARSFSEISSHGASNASRRGYELYLLNEGAVHASCRKQRGRNGAAKNPNGTWDIVIVKNEYAGTNHDGLYIWDISAKVYCTDELIADEPAGVNHAALGACGTMQASVDDRVANCAFVNGSHATWSGPQNSKHSTWKLVTKTMNGVAGKEVWRDERTGLLWSDTVGNVDALGVPTGGQSQQTFGWHIGTGNADSSYNRANVSLCAERKGFLTPDGAHIANESSHSLTSWIEAPDASGKMAISEAKGGMKLIATSVNPSVAWTVPTKDEYLQAYYNGMKYVLPRFQNSVFWTSSTHTEHTDYESYPIYAWYFFAGADGNFSNYIADRRHADYHVRCVGRL